VLTALVGATVAAGGHVTKAGTRVAINTSPEPFTNWIASLLEDVFVVGLSLLTLKFPILSLVVCAFILFAIVLLARKIWQWMRPRPQISTEGPPANSALGKAAAGGRVEP